MFDLIKHTFTSHSVEHSFQFVCGIRGCLHSFKSGSTFSSYKTHCSRKHLNWQDYLKESPSIPPSLPPADLSSPEMSPDRELPSSQESNSSALEHTEAASLLSIKKTSAMFLLSLQERFKLPQTAINFAIGSVNSIVDSVCDFAQASERTTCGDIPTTSVSTILQQCRDPFSDIQTEYMQNKFYREHFGLVVRGTTVTPYYCIYCI